MVKAKGTRFGPVGRCIYCRSDVGPLFAEHIVPANLGGDIILEKASCKVCRDEINHNIENLCMQKMFRDIRYRRHVGSRRVNKRPKDLPVQVRVDWDGDENTIGLPGTSGSWEPKRVIYEQHFTPLVLGLLNRPGMLRGLSPADSGKDFSLGVWTYDEPPKVAPDAPTYTETELNVPVFLKLIAKIAHGCAVFRYGLDGLDPFLADFILGKEFPHPAYFLGSEPWFPPPVPSDFHVISSRIFGGDIILIRVRLFANIGAPVYTAIVGKYQHDRARLNPYDRLDHK